MTTGRINQVAALPTVRCRTAQVGHRRAEARQCFWTCCVVDGPPERTTPLPCFPIELSPSPPPPTGVQVLLEHCTVDRVDRVAQALQPVNHTAASSSRRLGNRPEHGFSWGSAHCEGRTSFEPGVDANSQRAGATGVKSLQTWVRHRCGHYTLPLEALTDCHSSQVF